MNFDYTATLPDRPGLEPLEEEYPMMCECEIDWNCQLHGGTTRPTWIETRWDR